MIISSSLLISRDNVLAVDTTDLENLRIVVTTKTHADVVVTGIQAIEALMILKPSVLESRRLKWARYAWSAHNLVGHPLMQILAYLHCYKAAMRVHDATVPRPKGRK